MCCCIKKANWIHFSLLFIGLAFINYQKIFAASDTAIINVNADFSAIRTDTFSKSKVLNVARGGYFINRNPNWMPMYYEQLAAMGVEVFRVDWCLSDYFYNVVSRDSTGKLVYDFTNLDKVVIPMIQHGITPMFCMNYMSGALGGYGDSSNELPEYGGRYAPSNMSDYATVIRKYVEHYKELGYSGLYWESHNEPEGFTFIDAHKAYEMYSVFAKAVKEADTTARVGGFGAVGMAWINYLRAFISDFARDASKPPMDYFSFHQYGRDDFNYYTDGAIKAFTDAGIPVDQIPPFHINEWNTAEGNVNSNENAANVAKMMYAAVNRPEIERIYMWNAIDSDPSTLFGGGNSPLTIDGHKKASANVFLMYKNLEKQILKTVFNVDNAKTRGIITRDSGSGKISMIFWNNTKEPVHYSISIDNLPFASTNVKISKYLIDKSNGNYYKDYLEGIRGRDLGPSENMSIIESRIVPGMDRMTRIEKMPEHSVIQIILEATNYAPDDGPVEQPAQLTPANIAIQKRVSTSSIGNEAFWSASKLTDGICVSYTDNNNSALMGWSSSVHDNPWKTEWISIDLVYPVILERVILHPVNWPAMEGKGFPKSFAIEGKSDLDEDWVVLKEVHDYYTEKSAAIGAHEFTLDNQTKTRYLRIRSIELGEIDIGKYAMRLLQVKAYGGEESMIIPDGGIESLTALIDSTDQNNVNLSWNNTASNAFNSIIERMNIDKPELGWVFVAVVENDTKFTDKKLKGGFSYTYRAAAGNLYGKSPYTPQTQPLLIQDPYEYATFSGQGTYTIRNIHSEKFLSVVNIGTESSPDYQILTQNWTGERNQQWSIITNSPQNFQVKNVATGHILQSWGTTVHANDLFNGYDPQIFFVNKPDSEVNHYTIRTNDNGTNYFLNDGVSLAFVTTPDYESYSSLWSFSKLTEKIVVTSQTGINAVHSNEQLHLNVALTPSNAADTNVEWEIFSSSNPASSRGISQDGVFTGGEIGTVTIRATAKDASKVYDDILIYVFGGTTEINATQIQIQSSRDTITDINQVCTLSAILTGTIPQHYSKDVIWTLSNTNGSQSPIASLDANGILTPTMNGEVRVTAEAVCDGTTSSKLIVIKIPSDTFEGNGVYILKNKGTGKAVQFTDFDNPGDWWQGCRAADLDMGNMGQRFEFIEIGTGSKIYRIKSILSSKHFTDWNDRMVIIDQDGTSAQWFVTQAENGYYKIRSNRASDSKYLADIVPGDNIMLNSDAGDKMLWQFMTIPDKNSLQKLISRADSLSEQNYASNTWKHLKIVLNRAKSVAMDINATLTIVKTAENDLESAMADLIQFAPLNGGFRGEGTYILQNKATGKVLGYSQVSGSQAQVLTWADEQKIDFIAVAGRLNTYNLKVSHFNKYFTDWGDRLGTGDYQTWDPYCWVPTAVDSSGFYTLNSINNGKGAYMADIAPEDNIMLNNSAGDAALWKISAVLSNADKNALQEIIIETQGLQKADFASDSWTNMENSLHNAQRVNQNLSISQETVDSATTALKKSISELIRLAQGNGGFTGDGLYCLQNKATGKYLEPDGEWLFKSEDSSGLELQQFEFISVPHAKNQNSIQIKAKFSNKFLTDWGDNLGQGNENYDSYYWIVSSSGNGLYSFRSLENGDRKDIASTATGGITLENGAGDRGLWNIVKYIAPVKLVENITVSGEGNSISITAYNGKLQMIAKVFPADASDTTVSWSVINGTGTASIDSSGLLTALTNGYVTVRATAHDSTHITGEIQITISGQIIHVQSVRISSVGNVNNVEEKGGTLQLIANVYPGNATNKEVTWAVINFGGNASISSSGLLTAYSGGRVIVFAFSKDRPFIFGMKTIKISFLNGKKNRKMHLIFPSYL